VAQGFEESAHRRTVPLDLSSWHGLERSYVIGRNINRAYLEREAFKTTAIPPARLRLTTPVSGGQRKVRTQRSPATDFASLMRPSRTMAIACSKGAVKISRNSPWSRLRFCRVSLRATKRSIASSV